VGGAGGGGEKDVGGGGVNCGSQRLFASEVHLFYLDRKDVRHLDMRYASGAVR